MKYFTNELCEEINSGIKERRENAEKQWEKNVEEYAILFEEIRDRFSKKFIDIYSKEDNFHDYNLRGIYVSQGNYSYSNPVKVSLVVYNTTHTWQISYIGIEKIMLNYLKKASIPAQFQYGFDNFAYDEFLEINNKVLSHEILFGSGATLLIHFAKVSIKKIISSKKDK